MPDETVDNEWDPYDDALADADMLELFISNSGYDIFFHETILAVQVDPNFIVVFFIKCSSCTPEYAVIDNQLPLWKATGVVENSGFRV